MTAVSKITLEGPLNGALIGGIQMAISPWQVMYSNAGYYVGRDQDGLPYDRRSGYFKTSILAHQELCYMESGHHGHLENNGICKGCQKLVLKGMYKTYLQTLDPKALAKELRSLDSKDLLAITGLPKGSKAKIVKAVLAGELSFV